MKKIFVTTSWDDGHVLDIRLAALLKKYDTRGTFYIAPRDHEFPREELLTDSQIQNISESFEIGAHTMTHPSLTTLPDDVARKEIADSKHYLEHVSGRAVTSFCYPRGAYKKRHVALIRESGFTYARTVRRHLFDNGVDPLEAPTSLHTYNHWSDLWRIAVFARFNPVKTVKYFQWDNLAKAMFDRVRETGGVFHLWGHSWEIEKHADWEKLESVLQYIARKEGVTYVTNSELPRPKKRLLIATPYFPPYMGGVQLYAYNIAKRLAQDPDWEVCIATSGDMGFRTVETEYHGIKVYRLSYWFKVSNTPINPWWIVALARIMRKERISVINVHAPVPFMSDIISLVKGRISLVLTYHTGSMKKNQSLVTPANAAIWLYEHGLLPLLLRRAEQIVCPSDFVRFGFLQSYTYKSVTITPAVDTDIFKPSKERAAGKPTILFVGGLTRSEQHKGLRVLLDAFHIVHQKFPDHELVIVGDGNMKSDYQSYAAQLGLGDHTIFRGKLEMQDLVATFQDCYLCVLPSLAPAESFGMVLIEAMATGKPVIGTMAGGIPLVIDHQENGLLVRSHDPQDLAQAIMRLIEDPALAERLGNAGLQKAKTAYDWNVQSAAYARIFRRLLETRASGAPTIVHIVGYYPPHMGGMEIVAQELAQGLDARNQSVIVLTSSVGPATKSEHQNTLDLRRLTSFEFAHTPIAPALLWQLMRMPRKSIFHLHLAQAYWPEITLLIARLRRIPLVIHFHLDIGPSGVFGPIFVIYKKLLWGPLLRSAQKVIVFSAEQASLVSQKYCVKPDRIAVVKNGVEEAFFYDRPRSPRSPLRLLYVGRLAPQKRIDRIIDALALLEIPAYLTIVGDGEDRAKLESQVRRLGLTNVSFEGQKDKVQIIQYQREADVFVIASDREGMPLAVLEAMAAGLPIIGTSVSGTRELLEDCGILADEPYPLELAGAITMLAQRPDLYQELSRKSNAKARKYSWGPTVDEIESLYSQLLR